MLTKSRSSLRNWRHSIRSESSFANRNQSNTREAEGRKGDTPRFHDLLVAKTIAGKTETRLHFRRRDLLALTVVCGSSKTRARQVTTTGVFFVFIFVKVDKISHLDTVIDVWSFETFGKASPFLILCWQTQSCQSKSKSEADDLVLLNIAMSIHPPRGSLKEAR